MKGTDTVGKAVKSESDNLSVIDTSKMAEGQRAAIELTESARESQKGQSLAGGLFMGKIDFRTMAIFSERSTQNLSRDEAFLESIENFLRENVDPDEIDRAAEISSDVIEGLAKLGAFGIKIPKEYGGQGFSQTTYSRAAMLLGSYDANLTALISAHQSIGVPQPLLLFGTPEQKQRFLPRVAQGEISAFALTESGVGSDPATMTTIAKPTADGRYFVINGEKLWCTNGVKAGVIVVMAQTPAVSVNGREKKQVTAFIVEMDSPGVEVIHRCHFMGLRALYNGVIRLTDVVVPRENIILGEGKGLRVALSTLNTGRLTLPAACVGASKRCLRIVKNWANSRVQWGAKIGRHEAIAEKIAKMAANTFAMESMTLLVARMIDMDKSVDIRLEAAIAKMWASETTWEIVDETMQIRGGRGYETALSLKARGEDPIPVERFMRDCRINTIFEGSSEIMRLFIAREMLDPHLRVGGSAMDSRKPVKTRLKAAVEAAFYYAGWYPKQYFPARSWLPKDFPPTLVGHCRFLNRTSRKLAREIFHAVVKYGPKLERRQVMLGRFVDIGAELFAMAATCSRASSIAQAGSSEEAHDALALANCFCKMARLRINHLFVTVGRNIDREKYEVAQAFLDREFSILSTGIVRGKN